MSMSCCAAPSGALPTAAPPAVDPAGGGGGPATTPTDVAGASGGGLATAAIPDLAASIQALTDAVAQLSAVVTAMGGGAQAAAGAAAIGSAPALQGAAGAPDASTASVLAGQTSGGGASAAPSGTPGTQPATEQKPPSDAGSKPKADAKPKDDAAPATAATPSSGRSLKPLGQLTPDQFSAKRGGDAACGPAAAVAISRFLGKDLDIDTAVNEAEKVGWTANDGMAGPASEQKLLSNLGIKSHLEEGVDWEKVKKTVMAGTPVIIDTPTHYWVAERYDPKTGRFDFGKSGSVFKNEDRTWYTPEEMKAHGAGARAAIFIDQ
ncbi:MAG: Peptidase like family [Thermoleophilia bacterium]|nr:Peptidase like family [Thermoleophilia bacterium]